MCAAADNLNSVIAGNLGDLITHSNRIHTQTVTRGIEPGLAA